jgi:hypothetical protein
VLRQPTLADPFAITAGLASFRLVLTQPRVMLFWAALITVRAAARACVVACVSGRGRGLSMHCPTAARRTVPTAAVWQ